MGLIDALRKAEEQGREAARRGLERTKSGMEDVERRIRRKMRVLPTAQNHSATIDVNQHRAPEQMQPEARKKTA